MWHGPVARHGTCRACLLLVRLGGDDEWMWAELHEQVPPGGRPRQLALRIDEVVLPDARPVRHHGAQRGQRTRYEIPKWVRARYPEPRRDDPRICPAQVPGQLGLFPTPSRALISSHGTRIRHRDFPDLPAVAAQLQKIAEERAVRVRYEWQFRMENVVRLALAGRDPDQRHVFR
jgi:hypothetical protein